mgnify:CR=1 FL=1
MAVKNPEKPKAKTGSTALQEQGSLLAIYYAYKKGANLNNGNGNKKSKEAQEELDAALEKVYPKMTKAWYNTFINQAKAICKYKLCKHTIGTTTNSYKFGWYDGIPAEVDKGDVTTLLPDIWDLMGKEVWDLFGGKGQKDSWNTADIFLVKNGGDAKIMKDIKGLRDDYLNEMEDVLNGNGAEILVGTVNTVLSQYVKDGSLIPISLKMKTGGVSMTVKETNMHSWKGMRGQITAVDSEFIKDPFMYFSVLAKDGELSFGEGPGARDPGNSLQYFASFKVGDYQTKYLIEYRLSGDDIKGEVKDIKLNNKGEDKRASAQTGTVPVDKLRDMIKEYGGKGMDDNVPNKYTHLNNQSDIKYWSDYLSSVMNDSKLTKNLGKLNITIGNINEKYGNDTKGYITKLFEIDEMCIKDPKLAKDKFGVPFDKFPQKIRLKLRQLRVLKALIKAKQNKKMDQFIMETYYLAAKQNISYGDLNGPFLKVS